MVGREVDRTSIRAPTLSTQICPWLCWNINTWSSYNLIPPSQTLTPTAVLQQQKEQLSPIDLPVFHYHCKWRNISPPIAGQSRSIRRITVAMNRVMGWGARGTASLSSCLLPTHQPHCHSLQVSCIPVGDVCSHMLACMYICRAMETSSTCTFVGSCLAAKN